MRYAVGISAMIRGQREQSSADYGGLAPLRTRKGACPPYSEYGGLAPLRTRKGACSPYPAR